MPLFCAAQWILTRGGTREIDPLDEVLWREAFQELLDRIASEDVKVVEIRDGVTANISGLISRPAQSIIILRGPLGPNS